MDVGPLNPDPAPDQIEGVVYTGGWCAPSNALYDLCRVPDLFTVMNTPITPAPPPTLRQRLRALPERFRAARYAAGAAWHFPDGYWETD